MSRWIFILVLLLHSPTVEACPRSFFPETSFAEFGPNGKAVRHQLYSDFLCKLGEPVLHTSRQTRFAVRLFVHASWGGGVLVRIEQGSDGTVAGIYRMWRSETRERPLATRFPVGPNDVERLQQAVNDNAMWSFDSRQDVEAVDGTSWLIEILQDGRYRVVDNTSPSDASPIRKFGTLMLGIANVQVPRPHNDPTK